MLIYVPLSQIDDNPYQQRQDYGDITDLATDILSHLKTRPDTLGLQQVPAARIVVDDGHLVPVTNLDTTEWLDGNQLRPGWRVQLEFGHRRKRAFTHLLESGHAKYGRFPLYIHDLDDEQMLNGVWSENYQRKDISAVEQAELIKLKLDQLGPEATHKDIGAEWGLSRPVISNRLRLLDLPDVVQHANRTDQLSERQALALRPIVEIDALVNGRVEWGRNIAQTWGVPAGADKVIDAVLANPAKYTSDELRLHAKNMAESAGRLLPNCVARHNYGAMPGIEQPKCKGCRFRYDQRCLDAACLAHKREVWVENALEKFSQENGIPISDRAEDFPSDNGYDVAKHIKALYEAGITDNMVCTWQEDSSSARPFSDSVYNYSTLDSSDDGRAGIALGWRGNLPDKQADQPQYTMPGGESIAAWEAEAPKIVNAAKRALVNAVADAFMYQVADFDVIQTLMNPAGAEWLAESSKLARRLAQFLLNKGQGVPSWHQTLYEEVQAYQAAADRAGLNLNVLGTDGEPLCKTAVLILNRWYSRHDSYIWDDVAEECLVWIEEWQLSNANYDEVKASGAGELGRAIYVARQHIEQKLADKRAEMETAAAQESS